MFGTPVWNMTCDPDGTACVRELCSTLRPTDVIFAFLAAPSAVGLGVRLFLGISKDDSELEDDGDGELLLFEGSVAT